MFIRSLFLVAGLLLSCCAHGSDERAQEVRIDAASSVYHLVGAKSAGTGFVVKDGNNRKVIITNGHVCEGYKFMKAVDKYGNASTMKVLHEDPAHDLCTLEAPKRSVPLELADKVVRNEKVYAVGYPLGDFMIVQQGRLKGYENSQIAMDTPLDQCNLPKHKIIEVEIPIRLSDGSKRNIKEKICHLRVRAYFTTIPVDGGFSGSPMLNDDGEVAGVIMAMKGNISWGSAVPLEDLKRYLKIK